MTLDEIVSHITDLIHHHERQQGKNPSKVATPQVSPQKPTHPPLVMIHHHERQQGKNPSKVATPQARTPPPTPGNDFIARLDIVGHLYYSITLLNKKSYWYLQ
jgi:hypothetical protein